MLATACAFLRFALASRFANIAVYRAGVWLFEIDQLSRSHCGTWCGPPTRSLAPCKAYLRFAKGPVDRYGRHGSYGGEYIGHTRACKARTRSSGPSAEEPPHAPQLGPRGRRSAAPPVPRERVGACRRMQRTTRDAHPVHVSRRRDDRPTGGAIPSRSGRRPLVPRRVGPIEGRVAHLSP